MASPFGLKCIRAQMNTVQRLGKKSKVIVRLIIRAAFCCSTIHDNLQTQHTDYCVYLVSCQCVSEQRGQAKLSLRLSGIITNLDKDIISAHNQLGSKGGPAERRFRLNKPSRLTGRGRRSKASHP
ncbi:hypothetical protein QQF64_003402 [Cirrhinus molitorella]|uniref:Uncharacterized protein n=1 Tax=Cirrhinus molitorella TaxID=172907 RepID=A0ABR3ML76_9TELE